MNKKLFIRLAYISCLVFLFILNGCKTVQPYQRVYLNDHEMLMNKNAGGKFEDYVHAVREGGTVPGGVKSSGGCGCN
jgi:Domain of unknown function (DUF4266)